MPSETIGETVTVKTADHPVRTDSPEYVATRKQLMEKLNGGCYICGGVPDMTHGSPADSTGLEDHHGGGIYMDTPAGPVLVALTTFPLEWSEGFGTNPATVQGLVAAVTPLIKLACPSLGTYDAPITDQASVMKYVDSIFNANVKLCKAHHIGTTTKKTPDANGHEAVGAHEIPFPIFSYQLTCDWEHWDMFAGTTGTIAVAPHPEQAGAAQVLHVDRTHHDSRLVNAWHRGQRNIVLDHTSRQAKAAHRTDKYRKR